MTADPAFRSREGCPIEFVPALDLDLVQDCEVPQAPDPIWESPTFPPIPVPPPIGCPPIGINVTILDPDPQEDPTLEVNVTYRDGDQCAPDFDFEIRFPEFDADVVCTDIDINTNVVYRRQEPKKFTVATQVNRPDPQSCDLELDFDFNLDVPCTKLTFVPGEIKKVEFDQDPKIEILRTLPDIAECSLKYRINADFPVGGQGFEIGYTYYRGTGDCVSDVWLFLDEPGNIGPFAEGDVLSVGVELVDCGAARYC